MYSVEFDPVTHTYWHNGRILPSVTQVIGQWVRVPVGGGYWLNTYTGTVISDATMIAAQDRGSAVHIGAAAIISGSGISWSDVPEDLAPWLRQVEAWASAGQVSLITGEIPLCDPVLGFAGTLDAFIRDERFSVPVLVDFKTSNNVVGVGPQTAAYERLLRVNGIYRGRVLRKVLKVRPDGFSYEDAGKATDFNVFQCMLVTHKYKEALHGK